ncbi:MAG: hypothetical protein KDI83_07400 [Gammaproteobacteria bacterium]|nr:hypothetical protein [Gammaproteobacteria bacterium]
MVIPNAFSLVLVLFVAGCAQFTNRSGEDPLAFLAPGSEMQLVRDLEIASGETRVFFQRGQVISKGELDYYHPSCDLEVRTLKQTPQTVSKDLFIIGKLTSGRESVVDLGRLKVADSGPLARIFTERGVSVHRYLRIELHSALQPDVMRLTCRGAWDDYNVARFPSAIEIKLTLGEIMAFH